MNLAVVKFVIAWPAMAEDLPVAGRPRPERADAARNRGRVLEAARQLFAERGVQAVTMSEVARAAGVAKGTVFHRFGDRAGLALALVDEAERALQEQVLRGPPPLGPGAPPRERLLAFLDALAELTVEHRDLLREVEQSSAGRPLSDRRVPRVAAAHRAAAGRRRRRCAPMCCWRRWPPSSCGT